MNEKMRDLDRSEMIFAKAIENFLQQIMRASKPYRVISMDIAFSKKSWL